ncbi:MAG: 6-carboxytetrahydropterin synthase [Firmicutes bacterium]|nr:6-carboxytetrahydropterin synthase [Bacillota bacterium]
MSTATSIVNLDFQYAHRFMHYEGEAQYLHGHSGLLTLEIGGKVDERTGFAYPCKEALKLAWEIADNFHHGTLFQEGDPLLEAVLATYEKAGIRNGAKNTVAPKALKHELVWSYPECRVSVTKKVSTCENFCEMFYELLKDKLDIRKITFRSSLMNAASRTYGTTN